MLRRALRDAVTAREQADTQAADAELRRRCLEVLPYLLSRADSPAVMVHVKTEELVDLASTNSVPALIGAIDAAPNDEVARLACYFLARFETATNAIPHVLPLLHHRKTIGTALYTLGHLRARAAFEPAMRLLRDPRELVRMRAAQALGRIGDPRAVPRLVEACNDPLWTVRYAAEDALVRIGSSSVPSVRRALANTPPRAQRHLVEALAKLGDPDAVTMADRFLGHEQPLLRDAVRHQLENYLREAKSKDQATSSKSQGNSKPQ